MARYTGAKLKLARREGTDLFLKSARRALDVQAQTTVAHMMREGECGLVEI